MGEHGNCTTCGTQMIALFSSTYCPNEGSHRVRFADYKALCYQRPRYYGSITVDAETMAAVQSSKGAFLQVKEQEVDKLVEDLNYRLSQSLWTIK